MTHSISKILGTGFLLTFLVFLACNPKSATTNPNALFELKTNTGISFVNKVSNSPDFNIFSYRNFYNGGGVAIGDINNDGLADVFMTSKMSENKLYLNKGAWKFDDITSTAKIQVGNQWSTGVVMVDINSDGWLDIYVCNAGFINGQPPVSKLYINQHNNTFTEEAENYGLQNKGGYATHAAFFDYDLDGDLDVFIINNSFIPVNTLNYENKRELRAKDWPVADYLKGGGDRFLRNDNGKYIDISTEAGIYGSLISFGLGVTVGDVNGDHYPDVYVSNDFFERDYLYINQKNGTFKDELENWVQHLSHSSMGADLADINNDGYPDLFVTEMLPDNDFRLKTTTSFENIDVQQLKVKTGFYYQFMQNVLQVNDRNGKFKETAFYSGVAASDWSWGGLIFDADNDGLSDLFVCNGIYNDVTNQDFIDFFANDVVQKMVMTGQKEQFDEIIKKMPSVPIPNKAFHNIGHMKFKDEAENWGFATPSFSNGAAYGDLDNDGDLDMVINNVNMESFVYQNKANELQKNNFIGVSLKGKDKNTFAIGSKVKIFKGKEIIYKELIPSRGFQSSVDYKIIAGLGKEKADSIVVEWPDNKISVMRTPELNKVHSFSWEQAVAGNTGGTAAPTPVLSFQDSAFVKHQEDGFIDSYYDRNIPLFVSHEGPKAAKGDVNGDGLEDLYVGGASRQAGQLYLQLSNGRFQQKLNPEFERFAESEDMGVLFFDADGDKDLDLFVGSAGNNRDPDSKELNNRLFKNDGKGNFKFDSTALPSSSTNNAFVVALDFDSDGDLDLFVGSRSISLNYGPTPTSFLLENNGKGVFTDVTPQRATGLEKLGLLTGAVWVNINQSPEKELVVAGEWMQPKAFSFSGGSAKEIEIGLSKENGWWQSIAAGDLDGDGDEDLILGNIGENFYLQPSTHAPVKMWINDYDKNGSVEKIITRTINGKDVPVFLKRELTDQVVSIKKQNLKYEEFGKKSIQELFSADVLKSCEVKTFTNGSTMVAYNDGKGQFSLVRLPDEVQWSSVNAITVEDINGDGKPEIIAGGNRFNMLPQFCRLDASFGQVLISDAAKNWRLLSSQESGLMITGQIRDIIQLNSGKTKRLLFLINDEKPRIYKVNSK